MTKQKHSGSCLCGAVAFEVLGSFESFYLCHCKHCQKDSGSAHGANLFSSTAELKWLKGEERVRTFQLPNTRHVKAFCQNCGSGMPNLQMDGKMLVVPAGSLDSVMTQAPTAHIFCASSPEWVASLNSVPKFDKLPN